MNKSKIEWCDYTWNPVTGCLHGCSYCYARRIAERFKSKNKEDIATYEIFKEKRICFVNKSKEPYPMGFMPTFHPNRLDEPKKIKKPSKIFVVSMGDLFGSWVPGEWIKAVLKTVEECPQHIFMFLTKNPWNYEEFELPKNAWCGTTITSSNDSLRAYQLSRAIGSTIHFLSIEPLLGEIKWDTGALPSVLDWVIIGAQTGPGAMPPKKEWVQSIIDQCRAAGIPIFLKDNLQWPEKIQELPEGLK